MKLITLSTGITINADHISQIDQKEVYMDSNGRSYPRHITIWLIHEECGRTSLETLNEFIARTGIELSRYPTKETGK